MDITIRKNEVCVIGLPRCDFVFSSTRTCFIAYGFNESPLEMSLLSKLLGERGVQPIEAGGMLAPGQNTYCAKICSKIITAQFCIVLLNNKETNGIEVPSANVNMEYGLMLGFNKYIIPFQRASQKLPFNVAGLDTIKYEDRDFDRLAADSIDQAISATTQRSAQTVPIDQQLNTFLLVRRALVASLSDPGERIFYEFGQPLGFILLNDFRGLNIIYFGNFTSLRPEAILWRVRTLENIFAERFDSMALDKKTGLSSASPDQINFMKEIVSKLQIWILVTSDEEKNTILEGLTKIQPTHGTEVISITDVSNELAQSGFSTV